MKHARIDDTGLVLEVVTGDPAELFHADLAQQFQAVPDNVEKGWQRTDNGFQPPAPAPEPVIPEPVKQPIPKAAFLAFLTRAERLALQSARASDPVADDFLLMLDVTGIADLTSADGEAALAHFVTKSYLTAARAAEAKALAV